MEREACLGMWLRLEREAALPVFREWLESGADPVAAIRAAGHAGTDADGALTEPLFEVRGRLKANERVVLARTLRSLRGGEAQTMIEPLARGLHKVRAAEVRRLARFDTREAAIEAARTAGLLDDEALEKAERERVERVSNQARRSREGWLDLGDDLVADSELAQLLVDAGRAVAVTTFNDGEFPPENASVFTLIATIAPERFVIEANRQVWVPQNEDDVSTPASHEFVVGGKLYRSQLRLADGTYDLDRLVAAANHALNDGPEPERFVIVDLGDYEVLVVRADPARFGPVAETYHLPVRAPIPIPGP
jgi:hypothetical protein